jgi:Holliday junction DNA helicase RuvA
MIARLKGLLDDIGEDHIVLDVGGVGYLVQCSAHTLRALPGRGEAVVLEIETHVREDHIHLFGFMDALERDWFKLLQTVQGVGARVALGMLSSVSVGDIGGAIAAQDYVPLTQASGVGPKLAKRLIAELKDKAPTPNLGAQLAAVAAGESPTASRQADAVSALINLGYGRAEAAAAVAQAARQAGEEAAVEVLITTGLKELAS